MLTGWWNKYKVNRSLRDDERAEALSRERQPGVVPAQRAGLIRINSTYIDWIDSCFSDRGMDRTALILIMTALLIAGFVTVVVFAVIAFNPMAFVPIGVAVAGVLTSWWLALRHEFFTYTHYPIRFNRKTRQVHVFKHNGPDGTLTVPFDEVFFHIGHDRHKYYVREIRGHILDGDTVTQTFGVGQDAENDQEIYDRWEFIRRYMDEGPEAVADDPLDKYVQLSVRHSWANAYISAGAYCDASTVAKERARAPIIYWLAATRWLVMHTCKLPQFPPDVEEQSHVAADDTEVWPIPDHISQFDKTVSGVAERDRARLSASRPPS